jgi:hypothetical protein
VMRRSVMFNSKVSSALVLAADAAAVCGASGGAEFALPLVCDEARADEAMMTVNRFRFNAVSLRSVWESERVEAGPVEA